MSFADRRRQVLQDLGEVEDQFAAGEIDEQTARRLRETYERELETLRMAEREASAEPDGPASPNLRWLVGATVVVVAVATISFTVSRAATERDGGFITGDPVEGVDLDSVSNEEMAQAIEANPDAPQINAMRLALAERYFEASDYSDAFEWLEQVLAADPTPEEASEALGRMGWMVHASGDSALAESTLDRAIALDATNDEARLFLAIVLIDTGRPDEALPYLERVAARDDLPDDVRSLVESAIDEARSRP